MENYNFSERKTGTVYGGDLQYYFSFGSHSEKTIPYHNQEQVSKSVYTEFNPRVDKPH